MRQNDSLVVLMYYLAPRCYDNTSPRRNLIFRVPTTETSRVEPNDFDDLTHSPGSNLNGGSMPHTQTIACITA